MARPTNCSATKENAGKLSAISEDEVVDYPGTAESLLPLVEASCTQLEPGPGPTNLEIFSSNKISVLGMQHHSASVGVVVMKADYFGFMW